MTFQHKSGNPQKAGIEHVFVRVITKKVGSNRQQIECVRVFQMFSVPEKNKWKMRALHTVNGSIHTVKKSCSCAYGSQLTPLNVLPLAVD